MRLNTGPVMLVCRSKRRRDTDLSSRLLDEVGSWLFVQYVPRHAIEELTVRNGSLVNGTRTVGEKSTRDNNRSVTVLVDVVPSVEVTVDRRSSVTYSPPRPT